MGYYVSGEGIIVGNYHLVTGFQSYGPFDDPTSVNNTCDAMIPFNDSAWNQDYPGVPCHCDDGCLFRIDDDPNQMRNLARSMPEKELELRARIEELRPGVYGPYRGDEDPAACEQVVANGGFWGPWL